VSATALVSLEQYLETSYRPDREYLEGELLERNVGEFDHARLQMLLSSYLFNREKEWGIVVVIEQRVQVKARRFRIPDITVLLARPAGPIITEPPFLCVEILSPRDSMQQMQQRIDDYLAFGVRYVWVIDPRTRRAVVHTAEGAREASDGVLRTEGPEIRVPLAELE
jgi:Uma2 family endonuclease